MPTPLWRIILRQSRRFHLPARLSATLALSLLAGLPNPATGSPGDSSLSAFGDGASGDNAATAKKTLLRGAIEHSVTLPEADPTLLPGAEFREDSLKLPPTTSKWFQIPAWFAGRFRVESSTISKVYNYLSGSRQFLNQKVKAQGEEVRGHQTDARGGIWMLHTTSGTSKSDHGDHITYNMIHTFHPEEVNSGRVVMRIIATSLLVDKKAGRVVDSYRREDIKTYVPLGGGKVSVSYTSKGFNMDGTPQNLQEGFSVHRQVEPYRPIDRIGQADIGQLFADFLRANNLKDLVPAGR